MSRESSRQETIDMFRKMYIEDNMTAKQIAEATHYSIHTVRAYLNQAGCVKRNKKKVEEKQHDNNSVKYISKISETEEVIEKPYEPLYDDYVLYKGKLYRKLSYEESKQLLMEEQEKRLYGKRRKKKMASGRKRSSSLSR